MPNINKVLLLSLNSFSKFIFSNSYFLRRKYRVILRLILKLITLLISVVYLIKLLLNISIFSAENHKNFLH
jgi:hypothetical protein